MPAVTGRTRGAAWAALASLLAVGALLAASTGDRHQWDWEPGVWPAEAWRAWTAAFVHLSPQHFGMNLAALALIAILGLVLRLPRRTAVAWAVCWPLTHVALLSMPELRHYSGMSGVLHGAIGAAGVHLACNGRTVERALGAAVLVSLAAKVLNETPWRSAVQVSPHWDIPVAPIAHLTGAVTGAACSSVAEMLGLRTRGR